QLRADPYVSRYAELDQYRACGADRGLRAVLLLAPDVEMRALARALRRDLAHEAAARKLVALPDDVDQVDVHLAAGDPARAEAVGHHLREKADGHHALDDDVREPPLERHFFVVVVVLVRPAELPAHLERYL